MRRKEALAELIETVQEGVWPGKNVLHEINDTYGFNAWRAYEGSLDAAKALHEAVLPRHYAQVHMWPVPEMCRVAIGGGHTGRGDNPARAWLLAILRALHSMEPDT